MAKYFLLTWKHFRGATVSAFPPKGTPLAQDLILDLVNSNELPFDLSLVKLNPSQSGLDISPDISDLPELWPDYMPNKLVWPLFSEKLRQIIDRHLIHDEDLHWIHANVSSAGETRNYYVARFDTMHDVLDEKMTTYVAETKTIIRPWFSAAKVNELSIFPKPKEHDLWRVSSSLYVSELLKRDIEVSGATGVTFEPARIS